MNLRRGVISFDLKKFVVYTPYPGLSLAYHAQRVLFSKRSKYQLIQIIDNDAYGRMLFLDGNLQHAAYDADTFNTALCHPIGENGVESVLVIGGGSGQTVKQLLRCPEVKSVTVAEIDSLVVSSCRRFIRGVDEAYRDERTRLVLGDAFKFLSKTDERFDAAVIDLTENPVGDRYSARKLEHLYRMIRVKCGGKCCHYVGSAVNLSSGVALKRLVERVGKRAFSPVRFEVVFIPSFGAPHWFMYGGFSKI